MRYLRKFNESLELEIQDFSNNYLANLLDDEFKVKVNEEDDKYFIIISKPLNSRIDNLFEWEDVEDSLIPYLTLLKEKYYIINNIFFKGTPSKYINYNKVLRNDFEKPKDIRLIAIRIRKI